MTLRLRIGLAFALGLVAAAPVAAQPASPAVFVQGGAGRDSVDAYAVGVAWPSAWRKLAGDGEWSLQWELFASRWDAPQPAGGRASFTQVGVVPLFRWRPETGRSPLFFEVGIGGSYTDERFTSTTKTFSSRWNFSDNAGVGLVFGAQERHELSLRWQHTSNGGLKKPNPGLDLMLLRYAVRY